MGLLDKVKGTKSNSTDELTKRELEFLLAKLRSATYRGDEFETFYNVWVKISDKIDSFKQYLEPSGSFAIYI